MVRYEGRDVSTMAHSPPTQCGQPTEPGQGRPARAGGTVYEDYYEDY